MCYWTAGAFIRGVSYNTSWCTSIYISLDSCSVDDIPSNELFKTHRVINIYAATTVGFHHFVYLFGQYQSAEINHHPVSTKSSQVFFSQWCIIACSSFSLLVPARKKGNDSYSKVKISKGMWLLVIRTIMPNECMNRLCPSFYWAQQCLPI